MPPKPRVVLIIASICVLATLKHLNRPIDLSSAAVRTAPTTTTTSQDIQGSRPQCLRAIHHPIPAALHGHLPKPYINLGMPKMGSTSLQSFFKCGGVNSSHYECNGEFCADCIQRAIVSQNTTKPLSSCGNYEAYVQLDNGSFFPQIEYMQQIHEEFPNATFLLTFRDMTGWYKSISHWPPGAEVTNPDMLMSHRMKIHTISGLPSGMGRNIDEFTLWFCNHVTNVREFVERNPSHALIELDIENDGNGERLGDLFGIRGGCWVHANKNPNLGG